jgi:hypothetical protein
VSILTTISSPFYTTVFKTIRATLVAAVSLPVHATLRKTFCTALATAQQSADRHAYDAADHPPGECHRTSKLAALHNSFRRPLGRRLGGVDELARYCGGCAESNILQ